MTLAASSPRLDVIITAGDRDASRPVLGTNKVFLLLEGAPVITHVLRAVERAQCTARIFVVGNTARLQEALAHPRSPFQGLCPIHLIEQGNTLYENVWQAFLHTLPGYTATTSWQSYLNTPAVDHPVLVMSGDIPLVIPQELEAFVAQSDLTHYDYCLGFTEATVLQAYYPTADLPGIQMAYFTLRDLEIRQNNLHLVKPLRMQNRHHIQKVYDYRYQREWHNIARLLVELLLHQRGALRLAGAFLCLHIARALRARQWHHRFWARPFFLDLPVVCSLLSQALQTRFTTTLTPYGGCALDIDNAEHYTAISANFQLWLAHQQRLANELKGTA